MIAVASHASIDELLTGAADPDAVALLAPEGVVLRYAALAERVRAIGIALAARGVGKDHRVAVALANGIELAVAILGVSSHVACAPLDVRMTEREFVDAFVNLRIDFALSGPDHDHDHVRAAAAAAGVQCFSLEEASPAGVQPLPPGRGEDVALLLQTSGTTARAKRVALTHAQLCVSAANIATSLALVPKDRCLNVMPLFHVHGLVGALLASLDAGASVVCTQGVSEGNFAVWAQDLGPTWYTAVPALHRAIVEEVERMPAPPRLRFVRSASAPLPASLHARLETAFDTPVIEAYGMTEGSHQIASNPLPPLLRVPGSVGVATGTQIAILDDDGHQMCPGVVGEVAIRGPGVITRYEGPADANEHAFTQGWLRTGDLGRLDDLGYLSLTGRRKDIINRGGEKIMPLEIESLLHAHPAVRDCVVFAVEHPTLGEDVLAAVVVRPGHHARSVELRGWLSTRLSASRMPSDVMTVPALPVGRTGKVSRAHAARMLAPTGRPGDAGVPTISATEIAATFSEVLGQEIRAHENFFLAGGDSLRGAQALARLQKRFGASLTLAALFAHPTATELAPILNEQRAQWRASGESAGEALAQTARRGRPAR